MPQDYERLLDEQLQAEPSQPRSIYDEVLEEEQRRRRTQVGEVLRDATRTAPETRAEAIRLADQYRLPVDVVERNLEYYRQRRAEDAPDYEQLLEGAPRLSEWLTDQPDRAAAAQDDLEALGRLERTLSFGGAVRRGLNQVQSLWGGFLEATGEALPEGFGVVDEGLTAYGRETRERNRVEADAFGRRTSVFEIRGPWDLAQFLKETAGEQIPMMAPSLAGGAAGAAVGSVVPGLGTTVGALIGAALPSLVLGAGETQAAVKEIDPEASAPAAVFLGGSAIAALDSVLPGKVGSTLVRTFGRETAEEVAKRALLAPVKPAWLRSTVAGTVRGMSTEGFTEALQEAVSVVAAAGGTGTPVPGDLWRQMVEGGAAGVVMGGAVSGPTAALETRRQRALADAAATQQAFYDALATGVTESKLVERLPDQAREFLQRATKDGPVEHVYAPAATFQEYFQAKGINPDLVAEEITGRAGALAEALEAGTDLVIPTATYAVRLAGTEHHAFFRQELRLDPRALNVRETAALEQAVAETTAAAAPSEFQQLLETGRQEVRRRVVTQALEAGARPEIAEAWATLHEEGYGAIAARLGVDPVKLFDLRPPPRIVSDTPMPAPAPAERPSLVIPASLATPLETPQQRETRRTAHLAALTSAVLRDAQRLDPTVTREAIARELEFRVSMEEERRQLQRESGRGQDLLRAIAEYGGIRYSDDGGQRGELNFLVGEQDRLEASERGLPGSRRPKWNGVAGVFDVDGSNPRSKTLDDMTRALMQDPRFAYLGDDFNNLLEALDDAIRSADVDPADALPGSEDLAALGIVPGTRWWRDAWAGEAEVDVDESLADVPEGDDSFEFEQGASKVDADRPAAAREKLKASRAAARARRRDEFLQVDDQPAPASPASPFYSRLERAVTDSTLARASGAQWKATIRNSKAGINQDEYRAVGVDALADGTTYTREEVLGILRLHQVKVDWVTLSENPQAVAEMVAERAHVILERLTAEAEREARESLDDLDYDLPGLAVEVREVDEDEGGGFEGFVNGDDVGVFDTEDEARDAADAVADERRQELEAEAQREAEGRALERIDYDALADRAERMAASEVQDVIDGTEPQFSGLVLPGAEAGSYREVFLTAPAAASLVPFDPAKLTIRRRRLSTTQGSVDLVYDGDTLATYGDDDQKPDAYWLDIARRVFERGDRYNRIARRGGGWSDGHHAYDHVRNPIVRLRFNIRATADGQRVLFLEEVQAPQRTEFSRMPPLFQKQWRELAFKWALHHAATLNLDAVAWTSGAQQLSRYDLSQQIDAIWYQQNPDGTYRVQAAKEGVAQDLGQRLDHVSAEELPDVVGKDVADRILQGVGQEFPDPTYEQLRKRGTPVEVVEEREGGWYIRYSSGERMGVWPSEASARDAMAVQLEILERIGHAPRRVLEGLDLTVGGQGLRKLYDGDFPTVVNKLPAVKRAGVKVGTVPVPMLSSTEAQYAGPVPLRPRLERTAAVVGPVGRQARAVLEAIGDGPVTEDTFGAAVAALGFPWELAEYLGGTLTRVPTQEAVPAIAVTPALREQLLAGQALFQPDGWDTADTGTPDSPDPLKPGAGTKGAFNPATNTIRLIAGKADLSTFLHESGHFYLELLMDAAATLDPAGALSREQRQLVDDASTVLRWFGFNGSLDDWRKLSVDDRRDHHEQFARGFEAYLMEGRAPSAELRAAFVRFRRWLTAVYRSIVRLRVEVTPEVRGVMDRLLATDEAIAAAEAEANVTPLFTDPAAAGVDPLTFDAYREQVEQAHLAAQEDVQRQLLAEWRRQNRADWQREREEVRAGIVRELMENPTAVAQSVIRTGKLPDGTIPEFGDGRPLKLSKGDLVAVYGKDVLKRLPRPYLYSVEGGLTADVLAELVGFPSGDALVQALIAAPNFDRVVDSEADERMREKHGDLLLDGMSLQEQAESAVAQHRAAVISAELRALTEGMAQASIPSIDAINAHAEERIRRTKVRELKPGLFLRAVRKASREAFEAFARNDRAAAVKAKQQELVALALWRAALQAQERVQVTRRELLEFANSQAARRRIGKAGQEYLDQIDGFLDRYEFARVSQHVIDRRGSLRAWVARLEQQGLPIDIPDATLDDSRRINYQELTVDELEGVHDSVRAIAHLARLKGKLLKAARAREFAEVAGELGNSIRVHATRTRERRPETRRPADAAGKLLEGAFAAHRKIASLAREMDGFEDGGAVWNYIIRPLNDAADREAELNAAATRQLHQLFDQHYTPAERRTWYRLEHQPALGAVTDPAAQLSKVARLMVALNWGNETNRQRLKDGRKWTDDQVQAVLDTLDRRDWAFVQGVWDFLDSYWPEIKAKQERVFGIGPLKVDATPVFTRFGEFRGGYFPLKYDGELAPSPAAHQEAEVAGLQKLAAYAAATTRRGHTKERAEGQVKLPVRLDFGVIFEHVGAVIHDLAHHEALIDVGRLLAHDQVAQAIYDTQGEVVYRQFRNALRDVALGDAPARDHMERVVSHLRQGSTVVGLGWSATTAMLQPLGLSQSVQRIGARWVWRGLTQILGNPRRMTAAVEAVRAKSSFMRTRGLTQQREINEIRNMVGVDMGWMSTAIDQAVRGVTLNRATKQAIVDSYFRFLQVMQAMADVPTWLGAYEKAAADPANNLEDGTLDEARVVALADQAVLDSQGGGQIKDLASVQRGSAYLKLWTNFYSYFNVTYNLWVESTRRARAQRSPAAVGRLAVDYLLLFAVPATLGSIMRDLSKGEDDEEVFLEHIIGQNLSALLGTMIGLRELGGAVQGFAGWEGPAGARVVSRLARFTRTATEGKVTKASLRALNDAAGTIFHYPAAQVERSLMGVLALMEGKTSNPAAVLFGPPQEE